MLMNDKAWKICQDCGGIWGEHPDHTLNIWHSECCNDRTRLGYWNWVVEKTEQEETEEQE